MSRFVDGKMRRRGRLRCRPSSAESKYSGSLQPLARARWSRRQRAVFLARAHICERVRLVIDLARASFGGGHDAMPPPPGSVLGTPDFGPTSRKGRHQRVLRHVLRLAKRAVPTHFGVFARQPARPTSRRPTRLRPDPRNYGFAMERFGESVMCLLESNHISAYCY
jgi:hypothetical protein